MWYPTQVSIPMPIMAYAVPHSIVNILLPCACMHTQGNQQSKHQSIHCALLRVA